MFSGSTNNTAVSSPVMANFDHNDIYYQSGVRFFASRPSLVLPIMLQTFLVMSIVMLVMLFLWDKYNCSISNRIEGAGITTFNSAVSQAGSRH